MGFQQTVLLIAGVLLIGLLALFGYSLSKSTNSGENWPPVIGDCPDYWTDLSGNGMACVNTHSLGTCNIPTSGSKNPMAFDSTTYPDNCSKYNWATNCGVTWDGITSGVPNPCSTSTTTSS